MVFDSTERENELKSLCKMTTGERGRGPGRHHQISYHPHQSIHLRACWVEYAASTSTRFSFVSNLFSFFLIQQNPTSISRLSFRPHNLQRYLLAQDTSSSDHSTPSQRNNGVRANSGHELIGGLERIPTESSSCVTLSIRHFSTDSTAAFIAKLCFY
jgi:hypothetical protein